VFGMNRGLMRGPSPPMKLFENIIHFGKDACFILLAKIRFALILARCFGNSGEEWKSIIFYFPSCHRDMQPPFERSRVMRTCHSIVSTQLWTKGTPRKDKFLFQEYLHSRIPFFKSCFYNIFAIIITKNFCKRFHIFVKNMKSFNKVKQSQENECASLQVMMCKLSFTVLALRTKFRARFFAIL